MDLSKLDPNTLVVVGSLLSAGATWLYHKVKGDKKESTEDALWAVIEGNALKLAESDETVDSIRAKLTTAAEEALQRFGLKKSVAMNILVAQLVDHGITEVRKRVLERKQLAAKLFAMAAQASAVALSFDPPTNPSIPKLGEGLPGEVQLTTVAP